MALAAAGVAVLGSLLTSAPTFVAGFQWGMIISSVLYLIGTGLTRRAVIASDRRLEPTYEGLAYFLDPWERSLCAIHKHLIENAR